MKCTPANRMTSALVFLACLRELQRIAEEIGDVLDVAVLVVVRENDRVALALEAADLVFEVDASWGWLGQFMTVDKRRSFDRRPATGQPAQRDVSRICELSASLRSPMRMRPSAICTALSAAPLRRLSATTHKLMAPGTARSSRTRPTKTSSVPALASGCGCRRARTARP